MSDIAKIICAPDVWEDLARRFHTTAMLTMVRITVERSAMLPAGKYVAMDRHGNVVDTNMVAEPDSPSAETSEAQP